MSRESESRFPPRPTEIAHELAAWLLGEGAVAIDATAGNGHDTVWLAERVGETGRVLAFDIQAAAIEAARRRVEDAGWLGRVVFYQESHVGMDSRVAPGSVSLVMFNLGYLPGGDHGLTTEWVTTLAALEADLVGSLLKPPPVQHIVHQPHRFSSRTSFQPILFSTPQNADITTPFLSSTPISSAQMISPRKHHDCLLHNIKPLYNFYHSLKMTPPHDVPI